MLAEGLAANDWEVTLLSNPDSTCDVARIPLASRSWHGKRRAINSAHTAWQALTGGHDLVHSFAHYDLGVPLWPLPKPLIQSFQSYPHPGAFAKRINNIPRKHVWFTTCGHHMVEHFETYAPTMAIHNGIKLADFTYREQVAEDAPLVFLGRIEFIKGTHHAIRIAQETGRKLIIAGNRSNNPDTDRYFVEQVEPHFGDRVQYIGPVNDAQKNELLGNAAAFLMPIEWDEPFGIVMAEALACGTPVIGAARGALPEIVDNGVTGRGCLTVNEMIVAVKNVGSFSRRSCRLAAEENFASDKIVRKYIDFYESILPTQP